MADVYLNVFGNGTASTDALPPMVDGESFTIYCTPDAGESLLDVRAYDSHDYSVAIPVSEEIEMNFQSAWGNLYVDIYFSGSIPPDPGDLFPTYILFRKNDWWKGKL